MRLRGSVMRRPGSGTGVSASTSGSDPGLGLPGGPGPAGALAGRPHEGRVAGTGSRPQAPCGRQAHAGRANFGFRQAPDGARRCQDLLRRARAPESPAFLSMNACPSPGVLSLRARPLHASHREATPSSGLTSRSPPNRAPRGQASCSRLQDAAILPSPCGGPSGCKSQLCSCPPTSSW